ncbi:MAG TPA: IPT/TIG domain-containing protein [Solirubrobacteraceae bacterium]|jgi:hypothetical protein|nr:IPT/TIG domain-containing protein [Solirubrobacteraceae bacterium]
MFELSVVRARTFVGWRSLLGAAVLALLSAGLWQGVSERVSEQPAARSGVAARAGLSTLPATARAPVSRALGADSAAYWAGASDDGLRAVNRSQRIDARFDRSGVLLSSGAIRLGLALHAAGYGRSLRPLGEITPSAQANRVSYAHPGLSEWYVNGPSGIEQGFTLAQAPAAPANGPLTLALRLSGNAHAAVSRNDQTITLYRWGSSLRYGGLTASDASGRALRSWLELRTGTLLLRVDATGARFPVTIDPLIEQNEKLTPSGESGEGRLGVAVALSADASTALVGAPGDGNLVGAAWVFTRSGTTWTQQGPKLTVAEALGEAEEAQCLREPGECGLGSSVALSADGNTALIGAPRENGRAGAAWVFKRSGSTWSRIEALTAGAEELGEGRFGRSLALSADGNIALVGAPRDHGNQGAAWVFTRTGSTFAHQGPKLASTEETGEGYFGRSVTLSADGSTALVGSPGDSGHLGAAWAFTRSGESWAQQGAKLTGANEAGVGRFGFSVALSADGGTAIIGGRSDEGGLGAAWAFARTGSAWAQQGPKLTGGEESGPGEFGYSAALSANGKTALIGGPRDAGSFGAAWAFARTGTTWTQAGTKLAAGEPGPKIWFGTSVALAANEGAALVGAPHDNVNAGTVWTFSGTPLPAPAVTSISPSSGPSAGGTPVTITGSGFLAGATVDIGNAASSVKVISETEIAAVTAATGAGSDEVVVSDLYGTSKGGPAYTYLSPPAAPVGGTPVGTTQTTTTPPPGLGVLASVTLALPLPKLAVTGNLIPISGIVRVKLPGSRHFVLLTSGQQVPLGTIVDATLGKVSVTTARPGGGTQTATFYTGEFLITQGRNGVALATLLGGSYSSCPTARQRSHRAVVDRIHASRRRTVRKLWAEGHGKYSTKGNYATGAALGTRWLTEDLCEGTLITVMSDRVVVTNLINHRHVTVKAGHSYLARAH